MTVDDDPTIAEDFWMDDDDSCYWDCDGADEHCDHFDSPAWLVCCECGKRSTPPVDSLPAQHPDGAS